ncbi:Trimethyllysine dioxygenase [Auriculariales sp. MPI-PUGE-AT-0066]|nr:Trimethyllysine dioxygenase [Auriculariales sp. MPI-PUGE-AT-0066]
MFRSRTLTNFAKLALSRPAPQRSPCLAAAVSYLSPPLARCASSAAARILVERAVEKAEAATTAAATANAAKAAASLTATSSSNVNNHTSSSAPEPKQSNASGELHLPDVSMDAREVSVGWDSKTWSKFHNVWLRDHCRCPECFHQVTKQRLVDTFTIRPDLHPTNIESRPEGLRVTWPASPAPHVSTYPWHWLRVNSYHPVFEKPKFPKVLWGSGIAKDPPTVPYEEIMQDDIGVWRWLKRIHRFGFCFVSGVPATTEATEALIRRIAFLRETHYGQFWEFTSDAGRGDTAYTTMALGAHTDGTYYTDPIGLQFLHMLSHTDGSGGASLLVDGFYVASLVKELYPSAFDVLRRTRIASHAAGEENVMYRTGTNGRGSGFPIIGTLEREDGSAGEVVQIRYNNDDRSALNLHPDQVEEWYAALRQWYKTLTSADSEYWVQLAPGTVMAFDNQRVLHGRSAFTGRRHMCGAYMGRDDWRSRLEVLSERYGKPIVPPGLDERLLLPSSSTIAGDATDQEHTAGYANRTWSGRI